MRRSAAHALIVPMPKNYLTKNPAFAGFFVEIDYQAIARSSFN